MPRRNPLERLRIVVLGYVVRGPLGGHAWHHLHYVAGLAALGHDVWFIEDSDDYPSCYDPVRDVTDADPGYGLAFAGHSFARVGMDGRWAYHDAHTLAWHGPIADKAEAICRSADLVINVSGANPLRPWLRDVPVRVFIDTDPGFTQAENLLHQSARDRVLQHTAHFTFAERVGRGALLPDDGIEWRPTRQPVALELWPRAAGQPGGAFTTVMLWQSYAPLEVAGMRLGLKSDSFGPYLDLPLRTGHPFELALGGPNAPRDQLAANGWRLLDARIPTRTLDTYHAYIAASRGEFSVAKQGYVTTCSGWFSERSANYLASGRPVIAQDTGFSGVLPTGTGLLAFATPMEAAAAVHEVSAGYDRHCVAARDIAETCFAAGPILMRLIDDAFETPAPLTHL